MKRASQSFSGRSSLRIRESDTNNQRRRQSVPEAMSGNLIQSDVFGERPEPWGNKNCHPCPVPESSKDQPLSRRLVPEPLLCIEASAVTSIAGPGRTRVVDIMSAEDVTFYE
ncbi:uncharacterized protein LOC129188873 isoform X2 [Dunckerocampus dactyliophorus]|uniref:uncharacterized protein LOC129188873 isoform X2 n=1 Tax=Dunckerocampus dactyliophorus TaxID=161453 RepID=UPI00240569DF|nr:uncharacterized protein LOC129188873 isoform X2 [Dunckerocampus dactyliophorus]